MRFTNIDNPAVSDRKGMWATVFKPEGCYVVYCGVYPRRGPAGPIPDEGVLAFVRVRRGKGEVRSFDEFELRNPGTRLQA